MQYDAHPEAGWQALKYAARVLTTAEQAEYEMVLAQDQAAREAVSQAVDLAHSVTLLHLSESNDQWDATIADQTLSQPSATVASEMMPTTSNRLRWSGWIAAGIAASLAGYLFVKEAPTNLNPNPTLGPDQVTTAWAGLNGTPLPQLDSQPIDELVAEQLSSLREVSRADEEALLMDWLIDGLRSETLPAATNN